MKDDHNMPPFVRQCHCPFSFSLPPRDTNRVRIVQNNGRVIHIKYHMKKILYENI